MGLLKPEERAFVRAVSALMHCNPFLPERVTYEREALGAEFVAYEPVWHVRADREVQNPNLDRLNRRVEAMAEVLRARLLSTAASSDDRVLYEDLVLYLLYARFEDRLWQLAMSTDAGARRVAFYGEFARDAEHFWRVPGVTVLDGDGATHMFACLYQVRRAFHHTFRAMIGGSAPAARLRASVWQSIFTHDMRRYRRVLYARMDDLTTLIVGPTGTGKELVARAIGLSRYVPFDARAQRFREDPAASFHALNLSALSPTLIESELFGHKRGAFTGALDDRVGWLEACGPHGTVFLDEIGDLDASIQVKLLRVLQTHTFQRLGESKTHEFEGKIIAATNQDLPRQIQLGRFRADFYYRLCSDVVSTPALNDQLRDTPGALHNLVLFLAQKLVGDDEADRLAADVERWVERELGPDYAWPGNVRELEQCVRNVLVRGTYRPHMLPATDPADALVDDMRAGRLSADDLMGRYCALVYAQTGSYLETARRLGIDRRTVKAKVESTRR